MLTLVLLLNGCVSDPKADPSDTSAPSDTEDRDETGSTDSTDDSDVDSTHDSADDTSAPEALRWTLESDKDTLLRRIWENRKPDLADWIDDGMAAGDPTWLYNAQLYTAPLLSAAILMADVELLDGLAELYLGAAPWLVSETAYQYYYWPADAYLSSHPLDEPAWMWLDADGLEILLESSQFLYAIAALSNGVLQIPAEERTVNMQSLLDTYASVLVHDHYERWILATTGPFQVSGWGCYAGLMNHDQFVEARIGSTLCADDPDQLSYVNAVTDTDLWIAAGLVETLAANQLDPVAMPIDDDLRLQFVDYLVKVDALVQERLTRTALVDWDGALAEGLGFDLGVWRDHPEFAYTGYEGEALPTPADASVALDAGWDVSHARRFVAVFDTFRRHGDLLGTEAYGDALHTQLANQLAYGAFAGDPDWPMLNNFMDGANGWYRVDLDAGTGYGPNDLTRVLMDGGYGAWSLFNDDIGRINERLWALVQSGWIVDDSGNEHTAARSGGEWIASGSRGGAVQFSADGYIDVGASSAYATDSGSLELWFQFDGGSPEDDLINIYEDGYYNFLLLRRTSANQIMLYIEDEDAELLYVYTTETVTADSWHHLVVTQDGAGAKIYIDGAESGLSGRTSGAWTGHLAVAGAWLSKGHWYGHSGAIDEVRFYDRALSAGEVGDHYGATFSDDTGLLAWWSFDEPTDDDAAAFLSERYATSFDPSNSLDLLQFLPVFVRKQE